MTSKLNLNEFVSVSTLVAVIGFSLSSVWSAIEVRELAKSVAVLDRKIDVMLSYGPTGVRRELKDIKHRLDDIDVKGTRPFREERKKRGSK